MKSAVDKGSSLKSPTGGIAEPSSGSGFGVNAFVDSGGSIGGNRPSNDSQYLLPAPDRLTEPTFKPVDTIIKPELKTRIQKRIVSIASLQFLLLLNFVPSRNSQ